jgi:hypothetical protein
MAKAYKISKHCKDVNADRDNLQRCCKCKRDLGEAFQHCCKYERDLGEAFQHCCKYERDLGAICSVAANAKETLREFKKQIKINIIKNEKIN